MDINIKDVTASKDLIVKKNVLVNHDSSCKLCQPTSKKGKTINQFRQQKEKKF